MFEAHLLGNGPSSQMFDHRTLTDSDKVIVCNKPTVEPSYPVHACVMVDYKMMKALRDDHADLGQYEWVLGNRPKKFMETSANHSFYLKHASHIKQFYTHIPKYAENATALNCGMLAAHYICSKLRPKQLHMYGFDSLFDHNLVSSTDCWLESNRSDINNLRLLDSWRPVWEGIFNEFSDIQFTLHHIHSNAKVHFPSNVDVVNS